MNVADRLTLLIDGCITIKVQFKPDDTRLYTYKAMKNDGIVAGDYVVVNSPINGLVVVKVIEVHEFPIVNGDFELRWIYQKVDCSKHEKRVDAEKKLAAMLVEQDRRRERDNLRKSLEEQLGVENLGGILLQVKGELE